jgi:hypothetical protein
MKHSLILYGVLFQIAHATTLLTPLEQTALTEKLTLLIEQEHAHGHIPGDYPAASISVKVGFEEQESFVECICNVYLENQNEMMTYGLSQKQDSNTIMNYGSYGSSKSSNNTYVAIPDCIEFFNGFP